MVAAPVPPPPHRRVSYVVPPPSAGERLPVLGLPPWDVRRRGHPGPLYTERARALSPNGNGNGAGRESSDHPRHRLAVQALALDLSTALSSTEAEPAPAGILYTGGRDGLVSSWELGLPTRRRRARYGHESSARGGRERRGDGSDDSDSSLSDDQDDEDDRTGRDADLDPDLEGVGRRTVSVGSRKRLRRESGPAGARRDSSADTATRVSVGHSTLPLEDRWEVDPDRVLAEPAPPAKFRQCIQSHTDVRRCILVSQHPLTYFNSGSTTSSCATTTAPVRRHRSRAPATVS